MSLRFHLNPTDASRGEWVCNSRTKIKSNYPGKWNDIRVSLKELDFVYIMFQVIHVGCSIIVHELNCWSSNPTTPGIVSGSGDTICFPMLI